MSVNFREVSLGFERPRGREPVRVLLAEEDEFFRWVLDRLLVEQGYEVTPVATGSGLLSSLARAFDGTWRSVPHVIVASTSLPEVGGLEVLERLHAAGWRVPFVVCMEGDDDSARKRAWECGASYLLQKPFDPERLMGAIEDVVGARRQRL